MELYIIIGLLVLLIVLVIVLLMKQNNKNTSELNVTERLGKFETTMTKDLDDFQIIFSKELREDFEKLNEKIETKLMLINEITKICLSSLS